MKYRILFLWVSLVCVNAVYAIEPDALSVQLERQQEIFKRGDPIALNVIFKNASPGSFKLYQPSSFDRASRDWHLSFLVIRPDGSRFTLLPIAGARTLYAPRRQDYRELASGMTSTLQIVFADRERKEKRYESWEAVRLITPQEASANREQLAQQFNLTGDYFTRRDGGDYLVLRDLLLDVFNIPGEYTIMVDYANASTFCMFDDSRSTMRNWEKVEDAWTGTASSQTHVFLE
ncbi:MAG: hypothetical protein ABH865_06640 [Candidatus Omnitrophota bacterium]|nr:hypothetical protein [Candidatus Omnitrophota bacterium]